MQIGTSLIWEGRSIPLQSLVDSGADANFIDALVQGYSTSVASGPNKKITGGVRAAQNIDQIMAKNEKQ